MNMLRVWGGGIYEHDIFYDLCDSMGLLIWQDFMFACAVYPEEPPEFVCGIEAEACSQVRRLRSHPCLALWCGNNENQWIHDQVHWDDPYNRLFFAVIKDLRRDPVEPAVDITQTGEHELQVRLEAPAYAYFVHLEVPHEATRFSDNYLDLEPGQEPTIYVTNERSALEAENIKVRWR
jgi:beta-galactosidase/beta-glucuronidase